MTHDEIEAVILDALAAQAGCEPDELRRQLEEGGEELPIDSLLAAEVLTEVEERCGVRLPATPENAKNLTAVATFAAAIHDALNAASTTTVAAGAEPA